MNKKSLVNLKNLLIFVSVLIAFACLNQPIQAQNGSKEDYKTVTTKQTVLNDCNKAIDELELSDKLIASQDAEIKLLKERLELEKEKADLLRQISDAKGKQVDSLIEANNALREAVSAKDAQLKNKDEQIEILRKKKPSLLKTIQTIAVGIGIGVLLK